MEGGGTDSIAVVRCNSCMFPSEIISLRCILNVLVCLYWRLSGNWLALQHNPYCTGSPLSHIHSSQAVGHVPVVPDC